MRPGGRWRCTCARWPALRRRLTWSRAAGRSTVADRPTRGRCPTRSRGWPSLPLADRQALLARADTAARLSAGPGGAAPRDRAAAAAAGGAGQRGDLPAAGHRLELQPAAVGRASGSESAPPAQAGWSARIGQVAGRRSARPARCRPARRRSACTASAASECSVSVRVERRCSTCRAGCRRAAARPTVRASNEPSRPPAARTASVSRPAQRPATARPPGRRRRPAARATAARTGRRRRPATRSRPGIEDRLALVAADSR